MIYIRVRKAVGEVRADAPQHCCMVWCIAWKYLEVASEVEISIQSILPRGGSMERKREGQAEVEGEHE